MCLVLFHVIAYTGFIGQQYNGRSSVYQKNPSVSFSVVCHISD